MAVVRPNIRQCFVPDTVDDLIVDADLKGADAQVVAWEADDGPMKASLATGISLHVETATDFFATPFNSFKTTYVDAPGDKGNKHTVKGRMYDDIKRTTHGTNYGASPRTIALRLNWPIAQAERFKHWWLEEKHPGIGRWHKRTEVTLHTTRSAVNKFGYRILYFDRLDGLLPEALAWTPQSTVALASFYGAIAVKKKFAFVKFKLQGHDSNVFQIPAKERNALPDIAETLKVVVPYDDPLIMASKIAVSAKSWGEVEEWPLRGHK